MKFPEKPTCHQIDSVFRVSELEAKWREPREYDGGPYKQAFRTCYYCGGIHPEDLLNFLKAGASPHGSDWKYGWPHKFYIDGIPNPIAGEQVKVGSRGNDPIMGAAPQHVFAKWYNEHLQDAGFDDEAFAALTEALKASGIEFSRDPDGRIKYRSPCAGYQK